MSSPIEDYALIGDLQTAALVARDGSLDWLCWPRFDSGACFAALLGDSENGRWLVAPKNSLVRMRRRYYPASLILETEFTTSDGVVLLLDFMPVRGRNSDVVRLVVGKRGTVTMRTEPSGCFSIFLLTNETPLPMCVSRFLILRSLNTCCRCQNRRNATPLNRRRC